MSEHVIADRRPSRAGMIGASAAAAVLILASLWLPIWTMTLEAPQYPNGLYLRAYGSYVAGDLREINIINHYVGMAEIDPVPAPEMQLYPYAIVTLVLLALLAPFHRRVNQAALAGILILPVVTLADLQWWLHEFGQNLDTTAPLRFIEPFTPLAIGISKIGNFRSVAMVSYGFVAWMVAAGLLYFCLKGWRRVPVATAPASAAVVAAVVLLSAGGAEVPAMPLTLQERIDAAPAGATITVRGGVHPGPISVTRPITLLGEGGAVIEGDGAGSVIEVAGQGVTIRGFTIQRSGRHTSAEAAGIKAVGDDHAFVDNTIRDVYFGVHLSDGANNHVRGNHVVPGEDGGVRPGHAISLWYQAGSVVEGNRVDHARDGVYLSFADDIAVRGNEIRGARYGIHSMYSKRTRLEANTIEGNLVGAALMYSEGLTLRCNRIARHREGATAYAVLLKDIDDVVMERNQLLGNRVAIYGDNTPLGPGRVALVRDNLIAGNDAALALQSTVRLTFTGNEIVGNLMSVRAEGSRLSEENRWARDGRGNYWDDYHGIDRDGDGIGDLPYRYEAVMNEIIRRQPLARAFLFTPAHLAIEQAARAFPIIRPDPWIVDPAPLMQPPDASCAEVAP